MEKAWKRASMLFSAAAVFYGLGLLLDLIYIAGHSFEYCFDSEHYYCHMESQPKYTLAAGIIISGGLAKVSIDQSKRITDGNRFTLSIPNDLSLNHYDPTTQSGIGHPGFAYLFGLANFFLLFLPSIDMSTGGLGFLSILLHIMLTIFYFVLYKSDFFNGLALGFVIVVVTFFFVFATDFSELSIFLLVLGGLTYLLTMVINHSRGKHGISLGMLYGGPISFFGAIFVTVLLIFGAL